MSYVTSTCREKTSAFSKALTDRPLCPCMVSSRVGVLLLILSLSFWTASFFIPALKHFLNLQNLHWFLLSLSTVQQRENLQL